MVVERLEAQGIKTAGQLFKGLYDSGLSGKISSELYYHEKAHADADVVGLSLTILLMEKEILRS